MREPNTYPSSKATLAYAAANSLGEGPVWHAARQSFFWVDIEGKKLNELQWPGKQVQSWPVPQRIGMIVPYDDFNLLVALQDGLYLFNLEVAELQWLVGVEKELLENRPNDGKCDSEGRLWLGTMHVDARENAGSLYCIDENKTVTQQLTSLTISNGMAWSRDNKHFYFIDSALHRVDQYLFDAPSGVLTFDRIAVEIPAEMGLPDGMTIDEEGMLWVAQWDGFCVCRWNTDTGALLHKIEVAVPQVSSCTFGGENLDQLFITTARVGLSEQALKDYSDSGGVFIAKLGVKGVLPNKYQPFEDA